MRTIALGVCSTATWQVVVCLLAPASAAAQAGTDSLTRSAPAETPPAPAIGAPASTASGDTAALPTAVPANPAAGAPPAAAFPADTTLKRVCAGTAPGALAPGLLAVVFRPGTTKEEAVGAARAIGGNIGGMSDLGEVYVLVPPEAGPLAAAADQLIRQDPVTRVAPTPCPAPKPAAGAPAAGGARPDTAAPPTPAAPRDAAGAKARDSTAPAP